MEKIQESFDVGVIVGRFQVDDLTDGHKQLIEAVQKEHKRVIIFLGLSPCKCTVNNPLDFETRKLMLKEMFPNIEVYYIKDVGSDLIWSDTLDEMIEDRLIIEPSNFYTGRQAIKSNETICLYGSRDSFLNYYSGKFPYREIEQEVFISGTERRKQIAAKVNKSKDFRHGVIWATMNQWPACLPTVDIAIFNDDRKRILLGRKKDEELYRFIGGFGEPNEDFETTAIRETKEEASIDVQELQYVKSFVIEDWRYKNEVNKITTSLFVASKWSGKPGPGDDIHELRWFPFNTHLINSVMLGHRKMLTYLLNNR